MVIFDTNGKCIFSGRVICAEPDKCGVIKIECSETNGKGSHFIELDIKDLEVLTSCLDLNIIPF